MQSVNQKMSTSSEMIPSYRHILETFITQSDGKQIISHQIESFNQFMEVDIPEIIHMSNPITSFGSPEIPLAGPRSALATATGLSTTAANALMGGAGGADGSLGKKVQHEYEVTLEFEKISIRKPTIFENNGAIHPMMPNDARLRNLTYASPLNVDVKVTTTFVDHTRNGIRESNVRIFPNVHLGKIPVMVGSKYCLLNDQKHVHPSKLGECPEDVGGYFIIQGGERAMISMERMSENRPFVFRNGRGNAKEMEVVEIKCIGPDNDQVPKSNTVKMVYHPKNQLITMLRATVPRIKTDIPLIILFRALGVLADKDICELILGYDKDTSYDHIITESILEASSITTQEQALAWLGEHTNTWSVKSQKQNNVAEILGEELFPQIGGVEMNYEKACFLAHMTRKVLWTSSQRIPTDDRDAYPNKRVDVPGFLLADLFRKTYNNRMVKDMKAALSKEIHGGSWKATGNWTEIVNINNINKIIKSTILDVCLKSSLATGKFGSGKIGGPSKDGVSQVLNRLNYMATISHLRRISTPIEKSGKLVAPRKQHNTQFGFVCPCETPEGHGVGIIKNMATTTGITIFSSPVTVYAYIQSLNKLISLRESSIDQKHDMARVFLNGSWIGLLPNDSACDVVDSLRQAKRRGQIHIHTGIIWKNAFKELWITTEAGRVIRPLYYAPAIREIAADKTGTLKKQILAIKDWNQLMLWETPGGKQLFEYVDAGETEGAYIAMDYDSCVKELSHTHCEIHPSVLFGTTASCIPFPDHNQSPRNAYQASMGKQAMGVYALNFRERFDAMAHVLCYPEIPMVSPFMSKFYGAQSLPTGQNVVVAIMTYSGYNQEDSIMINRAALERGRYRSIFYRTYKDEERKNQSSGEEEKFCSPDPTETKHMKNAHYEKVAEDGFVPKDTYVTPDDILIGKVVPLRVATGSVVPVGAKKQRDVSKMPRNNESGFVDKIYKNRNGEGYNFVKIRMRQDRVPEIGDKFASRHAQKGTTGMILNPEDMPQTASGIVPDIIINPHCIPSRMTIAQLMETLLSKIGCMAGCLGDASPFNSTTVEGLASILRDKYEMEPYGNEIMYNGYTGRMMETSIFIGPCYYQRLRHCSADKMHSRASGPLVMLTRQPAEGRAREGGLRFGKYLPKCGIKPMLVPYGGATLSNSGKLSQETKFDIAFKLYYYFKMPTLTWKILSNYDNYSISNTGDVKNNTTNRILKYYIRNGYKSVTLSKSNCKKTFNIHTLVAEHFLKKPNNTYVVNHINEDKLDNCVENLEYLTYRDNTLYSANSHRTKNTDSFELAQFTDIPNYNKYMASKNGEIYSKNIKRLCRITVLPNGYHKIKMKSDSNVYKDLYIHVIIAMTYLNYAPSNKYVINHIDGNKGNNNLENLEIVTQKDNMKHSVMINNDKLYRRAVCYTDNDNNIIAYKSAKEASINTGIDNSSILKSCKSDNKLAGNIKWRFMSNS
jgi:DNA-directed RNA polymerase II subunit RPB2